MFAVGAGARVWVDFDADAEQWAMLIEDPDNPGKSNATEIVDPATGHAMQITLGTGDLIGSAIASVAFDGDVSVGFDWIGKPLNAAESALAADGTVTLQGGAVITVVAGTGHVRLTLP